MKRATLIGIVMLIMTACYPSVGPCEVGNQIECDLARSQANATIQARQAQRVADATRQAVELSNAQAAAQAASAATVEAARVEATRAAISAQATINAATVEATRNAAAVQATATRAARDATATAQAEAIESTRAAVSAMATRQAIAIEATRSALAIQAERDRAETEHNREVQAANMAALRETLTAIVNMFFGVALAFILAVGGYNGMRGLAAWLRNRAATVRTGANDKPILIMELPNGERRIVDPDRMIGPSMNANGSGQPDDWRLLDQVTRRDQFVDLWSRMQPQIDQRHSPAALPQPTMQNIGQLGGPTFLPDVIDLPEVTPPDRLALGVAQAGPLLATRRDIRGLIVAGAPRSGKSTLLQSIALQAARSRWALYLADPVSNTFVPDVWNRIGALRCAVAEDADRLLGLIELIEDEADQRAGLFRAIANGSLPPADLESYNTIAAQPLPPMLLIIDELNTFVCDVIEPLTDLARRGQKWGLLVILAAHSWRARDIPRATADLLQSRVVFRVNSREAARTVIDSIADAIAATHIDRPGRALTNIGGRFEQMQTYRVNPEQIMALVGDVPAQWATPIRPLFSTSAKSEVEQIADTIETLWRDGASKRAMARVAGFSQYGGSAANKIDAAITLLASRRGATTTADRPTSGAKRVVVAE